MNKLGMSIVISHPQSPAINSQIPLFADAGFDSFFLSCGVTDRFDSIPHWAAVAAAYGIAFEAVHAPSDGANVIWLPSAADAAPHLARLRRLLDLCGEAGVEKLVLHPAADPAIPVSEYGLERYAALEQYARRIGVHICYENSTSTAHLMAVLRQSDPWHGFCLDTGHRQCYTPADPLLPALSGKLRYTHLHDNRGSGADLHLLPFDGAINWAGLAADLVAAKYAGTLNLELACSGSAAYRAMSYGDFVRLAYSRAQRLRELLRSAAKNAPLFICQ